MIGFGIIGGRRWIDADKFTAYTELYQKGVLHSDLA